MPLIRGATRLGLPSASHSLLLPSLTPCIGTRSASGASKGQKKKPPRKKAKASFFREDMRKAETFALVDAMRYIRAFEVGQPPTVPKYELAISFRSIKSAPVIRNRTRLPHVVDSSQRVAVICDPESSVAQQARASGASLVGEDSIFNAVKEGNIEFNRCICHKSSAEKLAKANVARILGPRGLMPSEKRGTIVDDVKGVLTDMIGGTEYREKIGVVRVPIGQLRFTPEELQANVKTFMAKLKRDIDAMSDLVDKEIHEVVLSSTHSPGFPLNGLFRSQNSIDPDMLTVL